MPRIHYLKKPVDQHIQYLKQHFWANSNAVVLGLTSGSVFPDLYIDQCSLLQKHILDVAVSAYFSHPWVHSKSSQCGKLTKKCIHRQCRIEPCSREPLWEGFVLQSHLSIQFLEFLGYLWLALWRLEQPPSSPLLQDQFSGGFCKPIQATGMIRYAVGVGCQVLQMEDWYRLTQEMSSKSSPQRLKGSGAGSTWLEQVRVT